MTKPTLLFRGPVKTISGYGSHSRDLLECLYKMDLFEIMVDSCAWGFTPLTALDSKNEFHRWIESRIITTVDRVPDFYVQVTVPSEFMRLGRFNIGITAGIETTAAPKDWIDGCNKMDMVITVSNFSKEVLVNTTYNELEKNTNRFIKQHKIDKPIHVLFEGVHTDIFNNVYKGFDLDIKEDFGFLFVGHWLRGDIGQDRKDVGMLIKCFAECFKFDTVKPALVLKTSSATFSVIEREHFRQRIENILKPYKNPPPVYLLFGQLTDHEMNELYNHPKIKSMVSITKGEGFGRPLLEFTMTGKPIIASNWSGQKDFLNLENSILIGGELTDVHPSAVDNFIVKGSKWFTANYNEVATSFKYLMNRYEHHKQKAEELRIENSRKFNMDEMKKKFQEILTPHLIIPQEKKLNLPKLEKIS